MLGLFGQGSQWLRVGCGLPAGASVLWHCGGRGYTVLYISPQHSTRLILGEQCNGGRKASLDFGGTVFCMLKSIRHANHAVYISGR